MLIDINKITVGKRIRKDYGDITSHYDDMFISRKALTPVLSSVL